MNFGIAALPLHSAFSFFLGRTRWPSSTENVSRIETPSSALERDDVGIFFLYEV